jgi:hypothetical protein
VAPAVVSFQIDSTRTLSTAETGCAFLVLRHSEGVYHIRTFYDADGQVTRIVNYVSDYKVTDTNPLTGKSLTSALAGPLIIEPYAGGTVLVTIPGNDGHISAVSEGVIWSNVGRLVYIATADDPFTPIEILTVKGLYTDLNGPYPEACAPLT